MVAEGDDHHGGNKERLVPVVMGDKGSTDFGQADRDESEVAGGKTNHKKAVEEIHETGAIVKSNGESGCDEGHEEIMRREEPKGLADIENNIGCANRIGD